MTITAKQPGVLGKGTCPTRPTRHGRVMLILVLLRDLLVNKWVLIRTRLSLLGRCTSTTVTGTLVRNRDAGPTRLDFFLLE